MDYFAILVGVAYMTGMMAMLVKRYE